MRITRKTEETRAIRQTLETGRCSKEFMATVKEALLDYQNVRDHLGIQLCDGKASAEQLEDIVYTAHGDFIAKYQVVFPGVMVGEISGKAHKGGCEATQTMTVTVSQGLMGYWGITVDQLKEDALKAESQRGVRFIDLDSLIGTFLFGVISPNNGCTLLD